MFGVPERLLAGRLDGGPLAVAFHQDEADDLELHGPDDLRRPRPAQPGRVHLLGQNPLRGQEDPLREAPFVDHRHQVRAVAQFMVRASGPCRLTRAAAASRTSSRLSAVPGIGFPQLPSVRGSLPSPGPDVTVLQALTVPEGWYVMARVRYGARTEAEITAARTRSSNLPGIWSTGVAAVWETDRDVVAAVLPAPLKPTARPLVGAGISRVDLPGCPLGAGHQRYDDPGQIPDGPPEGVTAGSA